MENIGGKTNARENVTVTAADPDPVERALNLFPGAIITPGEDRLPAGDAPVLVHRDVPEAEAALWVSAVRLWLRRWRRVYSIRLRPPEPVAWHSAYRRAYREEGRGARRRFVPVGYARPNVATLCGVKVTAARALLLALVRVELVDPDETVMVEPVGYDAPGRPYPLARLALLFPSHAFDPAALFWVDVELADGRVVKGDSDECRAAMAAIRMNWHWRATA